MKKLHETKNMYYSCYLSEYSEQV